MGEIEDDERSIRIVTFDGQEKNWFSWSRKFLARAVLKDYDEILDGTMVVPAKDYEEFLRFNALLIIHPGTESHAASKARGDSRTGSIPMQRTMRKQGRRQRNVSPTHPHGAR